MAWDQKTLKYISGEAGFDMSTQLLDNTLATINNKMKQREQQQLGELRAMQIEETGMMLSELKKQADIRDFESQLRRKTAIDALNNFEADQAMARQMQNFEYATAQADARFSIYDQLLGATDTASRNSVLDNAAGILEPSEVAEIRDIPVGSARWNKKVNQMIQDREHQQKMAQIIAKESYSAPPAIKYGANIEARVGALEKQGVNEKHAKAVTTLTDGMSREGFGDPSLLDDLARDLYLADKERYTSPIPGKWTGSQFDRFTMKQDIMNAIKGEPLEPKMTAEQSAAPWVEFKKTREQWEETKRANNWTDQEMFQYALERRRREGK